MNEVNTRHSIEDMDEFYILGIPIRTNIGDCHFVKVKDYPNVFADLQIVQLTRQHFINQFMSAQDISVQDIANELSSVSLMDVVIEFPEVTEAYKKVFSYFFKDDEAFFKIESEEQFNYLRSLILKLGCITEEYVNPNPEIQEALERSRKLKSKKQGKLAFSDVVSSVSVIKGINYRDILEMTMFQLYMDFHRIAQDKSYQASTLFATVADKVEIEGWNKHIDLFEEEEEGISMGKLGKIANDMKR